MLDSLREEYYVGVERRKSVHYEFGADVEIEWCSKRIWGRVRNISKQGMFIELPEVPLANAAFTAYVALNEPLRLECVVRRIVPGRGIGVTVTPYDVKARARYEALLIALSLSSESVSVCCDDSM